MPEYWMSQIFTIFTKFSIINTGAVDRRALTRESTIVMAHACSILSTWHGSTRIYEVQNQAFKIAMISNDFSSLSEPPA